MMVRRFFAIGFAAALLAAFGCSDDDGGGTTTATIACTDGNPSAANTVSMSCGGPIDSATELVDIVVRGSASGTTSLRGLNFDVTYDPSKLVFVTATKDVAGPFSFGSLFLAVARPLDPVPHVVVSIQQVAGDPDVAIAAGEQVVVLHLGFARAPGTTTFTPTPLGFDPATSEVTPPTPPTLPAAVSFASSLALSFQ